MNIKKYRSLLAAAAIGCLFFGIYFFNFNGTENVKVITNVPVETLYDKEALIAYGIPTVIDVTITGPEAELSFIEKSDSLTASVNLEGIDPSTLSLPISYSGYSSKVNIINAKTIYAISLEQIVEESFLTNIQYTNYEDLQNGIVVDSTINQTTEVLVKGGSEELKKISTLIAYVDLMTLDPQKTATNVTANAIAYTTAGEVVSIMNEPMVDISLKYTKNAVTLPVEFQIVGKTKDNKYVSDVTSKVTEIEVYGDKEQLDKMNSVTYQVNLDNIQDNASLTANLILPKGVYVINNNIIPVEVVLGKSATKALYRQPIQYSKLDPKLQVLGINESNGLVNAEVTAAESVIENLEDFELFFYVDLSEINKPGIYKIPITYRTNIYGEIKLDKEYINIEVAYK